MPPAVDGCGVAHAGEPALIADGDLADHVACGARGKYGSRQGGGPMRPRRRQCRGKCGEKKSRVLQVQIRGRYVPYRRQCPVASAPRVSRCVAAHERKSRPSDPARSSSRMGCRPEMVEPTTTGRKRAVTLQHEAGRSVARRFGRMPQSPICRGNGKWILILAAGGIILIFHFPGRNYWNGALSRKGIAGFGNKI